ncbi:hypothetical protein P152DRAFT_12563 [Eremomyces bilateralis CBS 781.70]|uniref:Mitochondrial outer membrane transport complex Sam37/metaxin N-terminal domain-containing protein n=1 Tax=Eremomyces bilateralis CBS 781.70 TaxID=1392243 RepID=A0A6G1GGY4_9PEZI|nr:uncharacterized protein P152DRAFT_12563 [Eremomyces bilateralis CBS 781.70]KAF1817252.1 hypothetical protein P152DRAFT_12563 [Eremomyces bilateralis CBS 781.70]
MSLEVHVWGSAFDLPSIDPECLATVCLLNSFMRSEVQWKLIPNFDLSFSPNRTFPVLVDGDQKIAGYDRVLRHLRNRDMLLEPAGPAPELDPSVVSAFLRSQGQQLLDLSLYVSSENYYESTRSAYTKLLPLHINYFLPLSLRASAKARTQHLGLSSLDLDAEEPSDSRKPATNTAIPPPTQTAAQAGKVQKSITSFLRKSPHVDHIRLDSLATSFFDVLEELLAKDYFGMTNEGTRPVDCLLFGYLALMLYPDVPHKWLGDAIRRRYPRIKEHVEHLRRYFLSDLPTPPWSPAPSRGLTAPLYDLGHIVKSSIQISKPSSQAWVGMALLVGCLAFRSGAGRSPAVNYIFPAR